MPNLTPPTEEPLRGWPALIGLVLWLGTGFAALGAIGALVQDSEGLALILGIGAVIGLGLMLAWRRKRSLQ